jgi:hypothetical protein
VLLGEEHEALAPQHAVPERLDLSAGLRHRPLGSRPQEDVIGGPALGGVEQLGVVGVEAFDLLVGQLGEPGSQVHMVQLANHARRLVKLMRWVVFLITLAMLPACGLDGGARPAVVAIDPPHDLDQVDRAVREQFDGIWDELQAAEAGSHSRVDRAEVWGTLGKWFHIYRYASSAVVCYEDARRLDPTNPRWPYYLGLVSEESGDLEEARDQYATAVELAPKNVEVRIRLGDLALRQQDSTALRHSTLRSCRISLTAQVVCMGLARSRCCAAILMRLASRWSSSPRCSRRPPRFAMHWPESGDSWATETVLPSTWRECRTTTSCRRS